MKKGWHTTVDRELELNRVVDGTRDNWRDRERDREGERDVG